MSVDIKLQTDQWYRTRSGEIVYWIGTKPNCVSAKYHGLACKQNGEALSYLLNGEYSTEIKNHHLDIVEHLPNCTGFDWVPPKPIEPPEGWRLLTEGETILATDQWFDRYWSFFTKETPAIGQAWNQQCHTPIARKIQPRCRPFKNAEEFKPFRDKWVKYKQSDVKKTMQCVSCSNEGVTVCVSFMPYKTAFDSLIFEDGTPFGVLEQTKAE